MDSIPTVFGTPFEGGFYAGRIVAPGHRYALILPPKAIRQFKGKWGKDTDVPGARSLFDGKANTLAMAEAGSKLAQKILDTEFAGAKCLHLPSLDELEVIYRAGKPGTDANYCFLRSGINLHTEPPSYPYTPESPVQTPAELFRTGGAEAFEPTWHWSSTQYSRNDAWYQGVVVGGQNYYDKSYEGLAVAVRRFDY